MFPTDKNISIIRMNRNVGLATEKDIEAFISRQVNMLCGKLPADPMMS